MKAQLLNLIQEYPKIFEVDKHDPPQLSFLRKVLLDAENKPKDLFALLRLMRAAKPHAGEVPIIIETFNEIQLRIMALYSSNHEEYTIDVIKQTMPYLDAAPIKPVVVEYMNGDQVRIDEVMEYLESRKIHAVIDFIYERPEHHASSTYKGTLEKILEFIMGKRKNWL